MVGLRGVDCSQPISGQALADADYAWVGRYLTNAFPQSNPKEITRREHDDHAAHGVGDLLFGEDGTADLTQGPQVALAKARGYIAVAESMRVRESQAAPVVIVMCDDENSASEESVIGAMQSASAAIRAAGYSPGYYGRKSVARRLQAAAIIDVCVVVDTWGETLPSDHWNFRQLPNAGFATVGGVECDQDDSPYPYGLWGGSSPPAPPVPAPPHPPLPLPPVQHYQGGRVRTPINVGPLDGNGNGFDRLDGRDAQHPAVLFAKATAVFSNAADPATAHGYTPIPRVAMNDNAGHVEVVVEGGQPGGVYLVFVTAEA